MRTLKARKFQVGLVLLVLLLGACKAESPTAPPPGGGGPPGGTTPPTNVSLSLASSNATPLVDSSVTITATATLNGQPVANGTAVQFSSNSGTLDGAAGSILKTTTNGVATVVLSSSTPGAVRVTATVTNVSRTIDVTFRERPVEEPEPSTVPTISSVTPSIGVPGGGEIIRITGTNFKNPIKVLFDTGGARPLEGFVVNATETTIDVVTPSVDLGAGQQLVADIILLNEAGTTREQRVVKADAFTFRREQLTPVLSTASPNAGPVVGGTRVTIFGEGFQAPVQVLFGSAEARVIDVKYGLILVEAPNGRSTNPNGSGTVTGPVDITVRNINSNTEDTLPGGFRYIAAMQITAVSPTEGPSTGGSRVVIDGIGFVGPVQVTIGGIPAQPVDVTGTRIVALTGSPELAACSDVTGAVTVVNIVNGDTATAASSFTFNVPTPTIIDVDPSTVAPGGAFEVTVDNAQPGPTRFKIGDATVIPTGATVNVDGSTTFDLVAPAETTLVFETEPCTEAGIPGERRLDLTLDLTYQHVQTACSDTLPDGLTIDVDNSCEVPPVADASISPVTPPCISMGNVTAAGTVTGSTTFTMSNFGGQPLIISSATPTGVPNNTTTVTVSPPSATIAPGGSQVFTVTADPAAAGAFGGTITITTSDPDEPTFTFCFTGTGI